MSLVGIVKTKNNKGFTIVELLIVIVVIGILAAIVIIAFNGVQNKAKTTKNDTNASAVQKAAESYNAINGNYPMTIATLTATNNTVSVPPAISIVSTGGVGTAGIAVTAANGATSIQYDFVAGGVGARIKMWDFSINNVSADIIYLGSATSTSTFVTTS